MTFSIFQNIKNTRDFESTTGLTRGLFYELLDVFVEVENKLKPQQESFNQFYEPVLDTPDIRLFFTLFYLKAYPTWEIMGLSFGLDSSNAHRQYNKILPILKEALSQQNLLPARDQDTLKNLIKHEQNILIDVTERPIERPQDQEKQKDNYSGKKKDIPSRT